MFSSAQLLPSTQLPIYAQLQVPVATTGLPHSTMWLQQDAAHQPLVVSLTDGGVVQHTSLLQLSPGGVPASAGMQQLAAQPPSQAQGPAGSVDVGRLKAVLQNVLASLHASQPASTASTSAAVPQQLQGPGAVLGLPQPAMPAQYVQPQLPQPPQQVYVTPSGQQVVLVGGGPPVMQQEGPAYAYAADGSNIVQLQLVPSHVVGGVANNQQILVSTSAGQEVQVLFNAEVPQPAVLPAMTNNGAYGMPGLLADFAPGMVNNMQANAALGANLSGYVAVGANQAWNNSGPLPSTSSSASGQQLFVLGASDHSSFQLQQPSNSLQAGIHAGIAPGHAGALEAFMQAPQGAAPPAPVHAAGIAPAHAGALAAFAQAPQGPGAAPPAPAHAAPAAPAQAAAPAPAHAAAPAPAHAAAPAPANAGPAAFLPAPWATMPLLQGLQLLWDKIQVQEATGGRIYNTAERMAWQPPAVVELSAQDLYNFPKLKSMVHKLNAVHKIRVRLIRRLHAVADFGGGELKSVYFEVRCIITEMMRAADAHRWESARITDLVRLALALQEALVQGPGAIAAAAAAE